MSLGTEITLQTDSVTLVTEGWEGLAPDGKHSLQKDPHLSSTLGRLGFYT